MDRSALWTQAQRVVTTPGDESPVATRWGYYLAAFPPLNAWPQSSTMPLLDDPEAFSQQSLLTPDQFAKAAERQGSASPAGGLEELHRRRLLVPFYRVDLEALSASEGEQVRNVSHRWLPALRGTGVVHDCAKEPFRRWSGASGQIRSEHFYAPWQLLGFERLVEVFRFSTARRTRSGIRQELPAATPLERRQARRLRDLAITLTRLDHRYRPEITGRLRGKVDRWAETRSVPAAAILQESNCSPDDLVQQAESLLAGVHRNDPLGKWIRVVQHANADGLDALRGTARAAMQRRVAAEMLLQLREDLAEGGDAPGLPRVSDEWWEPRHERLRGDRRDLDRALLDLGVSPHPRLIIAVEGETEELIMPRVLEMVGVPLGDGRVELVNLRGIDHDLEVLARYAGAPRLGKAYPDGVMLRRPLAHIAIAVDREKRYRTAAGRKAIKNKLVQSLEHAVPSKYRTRRFRADLHHLVSIHTWGPKPFEFAHFSDTELAIAATQHTRSTTPVAKVRWALRQTRRSPNPDVSRALRRLVPNISKPELAEALWPTLNARIEDSILNDTTAPPSLRIALQIREHLNEVAPIRAIRL